MTDFMCVSLSHRAWNRKSKVAYSTVDWSVPSVQGDILVGVSSRETAKGPLAIN